MRPQELQSHHRVERQAVPHSPILYCVHSSTVKLPTSPHVPISTGKAQAHGRTTPVTSTVQVPPTQLHGSQDHMDAWRSQSYPTHARCTRAVDPEHVPTWRPTHQGGAPPGAYGSQALRPQRLRHLACAHASAGHLSVRHVAVGRHGLDTWRRQRRCTSCGSGGGGGGGRPGGGSGGGGRACWRHVGGLWWPPFLRGVEEHLLAKYSGEGSTSRSLVYTVSGTTGTILLGQKQAPARASQRYCVAGGNAKLGCGHEGAAIVYLLPSHLLSRPVPGP